MAMGRRWKRFKRQVVVKVYNWSKRAITLERVVGLFVVVCVIFILFCNHILENPVNLKSVDVTHFSLSAGTLRLPQHDTRIVNHIQKRFLKRRPHFRKLETEQSILALKSSKVTNFVLKLLKNQTNGFFVEYPAKDGILNSQTLFLEKTYNWTGLLVEHDSKYIKRLQTMERYSWISTACLSSNNYPESEMHARTKNLPITPDLKWKFMSSSAQCFPLYSILLAVNVTTVDFLSLHLATPAVQLSILKTIPFNKVSIKVIAVDVESHTKEYRDIFLFVTSKGYIMPRYIKQISNDESSCQIYIHNTHFLADR